jgi:hypothetical protein
LRSNGGFSNYNGFQAEFRANNLFKQLTVRAGYTFSRNLDNVSEIFSTGAGGNTLAFAQNPFAQGSEYSTSGLDVPHQGTILFTEEFPFFKEQHGFIGHLLGGWAISGNYVIASGQPYTAGQFVANQLAPLRSCGPTGTAACNFFDSTFFNGFIGLETDRPFVGNPNAPVTSVGGFCQDAVRLAGVARANAAATCTGAGVLPTDLISVNALNSTNGASIVKVSTNDVRYILNTGIAETVFGTPFGNAKRNGERDAITNIANASLMKRFKLGEHASF